jgi:hypothetical protein
LRAVKKLSKSFSSGPDEIPAVLVSNCSDFIIDPLCRLFTVAFACDLPHIWLCSDIVPLYKGSGLRRSVMH